MMMADIFRKYCKDNLVGAFTEAWMTPTYKPMYKDNLTIVYNRFLKRSFDVVTATILLLGIFSWLFPVIALLIKIDSGGPVFFIQERMGMNRKSFNCIKFRTMYVDREAKIQRTAVGDNRITRVGFLLRKYFIDEVPQLINVLRGDMSMVGPRPYMLPDVERDAKLIAYYHDRHKVKPGLTGLAQIRGYHGYIKNHRDVLNRFSSDIEYIENWSLTGDLMIIFGTVIHIIKDA